MNRNFIKLSTALSAALSAMGCAAIPLPVETLQRNEASIRGAEEVGALKVPAAKLHLQMAIDQTAMAKRLAADGDKRATLVAARAQADAELALVLAREATVHSEALRAAEDLKLVQSRPTP